MKKTTKTRIASLIIASAILSGTGVGISKIIENEKENLIKNEQIDLTEPILVGMIGLDSSAMILIYNDMLIRNEKFKTLKKQK